MIQRLYITVDYHDCTETVLHSQFHEHFITGSTPVRCMPFASASAHMQVIYWYVSLSSCHCLESS